MGLARRGPGVVSMPASCLAMLIGGRDRTGVRTAHAGSTGKTPGAVPTPLVECFNNWLTWTTTTDRPFLKYHRTVDTPQVERLGLKMETQRRYVRRVCTLEARCLRYW